MSVVLVTGCSSGIGMAAAVEFARQGATVVATMRDLDRSSALRDALAAAGCEADVRALDVDGDEAVPRVLSEVSRDHGGVDIVVSNAGIGIDGTTEELSLAEFRRSFETNVLGSVRMLHALLPAWRARGSGRLIAVSSVSGALGMPFNDAYCMSKFALEGLLESLHPVVAQHGIHVSVVEPGPVAGDFAREVRSTLRSHHGRAVRRAARQVPSGAGHGIRKRPDQRGDRRVSMASGDGRTTGAALPDLRHRVPHGRSQAEGHERRARDWSNQQVDLRAPVPGTHVFKSRPVAMMGAWHRWSALPCQAPSLIWAELVATRGARHRVSDQRAELSKACVNNVATASTSGILVGSAITPTSKLPALRRAVKLSARPLPSSGVGWFEICGIPA